jgi:hypothetical protein
MQTLITLIVAIWIILGTAARLAAKRLSLVFAALGVLVSASVHFARGGSVGSAWLPAVAGGVLGVGAWLVVPALGVLLFSAETYCRIQRSIEQNGGDTIEGFVEAHYQPPLLPRLFMAPLERCVMLLGTDLFLWLTPLVEESAREQYMRAKYLGIVPAPWQVGAFLWAVSILVFAGVCAGAAGLVAAFICR